MPGMMRLVNAAASITPAANPSAVSSARSEGSRQTSTSDAPKRFIVAMTPRQRSRYVRVGADEVDKQLTIPVASCPVSRNTLLGVHASNRRSQCITATNTDADRQAFDAGNPVRLSSSRLQVGPSAGRDRIRAIKCCIRTVPANRRAVVSPSRWEVVPRDERVPSGSRQGGGSPGSVEFDERIESSHRCRESRQIRLHQVGNGVRFAFGLGEFPEIVDGDDADYVTTACDCNSSGGRRTSGRQGLNAGVGLDSRTSGLATSSTLSPSSSAASATVRDSLDAAP